MNQTVRALVEEICKLKGIDLTAQLKGDIDEVFGVITEDVLEEGIRAKLRAIRVEEETLKTVLKTIDNQVGRLDCAIGIAKRQMESLQKNLDGVGPDERKKLKYPLVTDVSVDARNLYLNILESGKTILGECWTEGSATELLRGASYISWKYLELVKDGEGRSDLTGMHIM